MELIKNDDVSSKEESVLNEINIQGGAGSFIVEGGFHNKSTIVVHYYKPQTFTPESNVIIVLPGAGRNGDDYRDAWIKQAEEYNILVLSPEYTKANYPGFWNYNLAGMMTDVKINAEQTDIESFKISKSSDEWIFNDFDRIFDLAKNSLNLNVDTYDMFGHSAGGQILHRLALFKSDNKANRILASNSGWYTMPTDADEFPYGLKSTIISAKEINFNSNLILYLGEKDDRNETNGHLRRSPEADKQGLSRIERGRYFYNESKKIAAKLDADFSWRLEVVPGVGHSHRQMGKAAADFLYKVTEQERLP